MKKGMIALLAALLLFSSFAGYAERIDKKAADASHVFIGKVKKVDCTFETNRWGDFLIVSRVSVKVDKALKGTLGSSVDLQVEGGTVGDLTLVVSEIPLFEAGQSKTFYLKKSGTSFEYLDSEDAEELAASNAAKAPKGKATCCKTFAAWANPVVPFAINPTNGDMSLACAETEILAGAAAWNNVCGVKLTYAGPNTNPGLDVINPNDQNRIFFRNTASGNTIAVTYLWYSQKKMIAFDMIFYDGGWKFFSRQPSSCTAGCSNGFLLQVIAAHELGHAIGIDHNTCASSIMYPYANYCATNGQSSDDISCARGLYGN